ncbi:LysR family transcriptional regulator [Actinomyces lilanjuaniae]|uniref:LysR family transcriptional regulator n=1 Tax=Actinomyces lilanjuaniae TaxID=2321394 RepID=A0ABM6Z1M0_9ACTO|nr:LysR family transcriptional regulator [Actinomyces lilanjuaniae]AYD89118.1 LysR family transcriptional regulator [Actinomyces lilanjuaniae]
MDLDRLRQLDAIAREGTVSDAARVLHLSQPALSRSLRRLEAELGQPLFDRSGRRLEFNEAGRVALEHARHLLRDERAMRVALDDLARRTRALRVGTVAPAPLWRLTALTVERFPGLVLTSQMLAEEEVEAGVQDGALDLGVVLSPVSLPSVRSAWLMEENLAVALPCDHPLADRTEVTTAELDGETFLLLADIGVWREVCDHYLPHSQFIVQEDRSVFEQMARSSPLPHFVTDAPSLAGSVGERVVVPVRDVVAHADFYLVVRDGCREESREVYDWVRDQVDGPQPRGMD